MRTMGPLWPLDAQSLIQTRPGLYRALQRLREAGLSSGEMLPSGVQQGTLHLRNIPRRKWLETVPLRQLKSRGT